MNCTLALRMLDPYVDNELDAATAAEVAEHVASCTTCAQVHGERVALQAVLRGPSLRHAAPAGLRQSILRGLERVPPARPRARTWHWWQALALSGSTALLGALCGWWLAQPAALQSLPDIAVARHVAALAPAGPRIDVASSDHHVIRPWFQGRLDFAPTVRELSAQGFDLVGARVDHVGDRQAVAVVYRLRGHIIDVFSWHDRDDAAAPPREATVRGFNVIVWRDGDLDYAAVSDAERGELARFVAAYRAP